jgi:DNA-binding CsgD family transcriptional regulator
VLVERETELGLLTQALAAEGDGSVVVISGSLGNGKSALLQAFSEHARSNGAQVSQATASRSERELSLGVVRQLLDSPALSGISAATGSADDRSPMVPDPRSLMKHIGVERPSLIVVDDLQWADERSLRWLAVLAQWLMGKRVLLVVTVGDGDPLAEQPWIQQIVASARHTLRPEPLSQAGVRALVQEHFGEPGDEDFVLACHETSGGNPMLLLPTLAGMAASGFRPGAEEAETARSFRTSWLRNRLTSVLRSHTEPVQEFARALAILGADADLDLIGQVARLDVACTAGAFDLLRRTGMLACVDKPRFGHQVMQEAAEMSMTVEEREHRHARAARLLYESGYPPREVAAQLLAVTSSQGPWAIEVLRAAADSAVRAGDGEAAAGYLHRALLDTPPDGGDRAALLVELATVERGYDPATSVRHMSYALPLLRRPRAMATAVLRLPPTLIGPDALPLRDLFGQVAEQFGELENLADTDRDLALRLEARLQFLGRSDPAELAGAEGWLHGLGPEQLLNSGGGRELLASLLHSAVLRLSMPADDVATWANRILDHEPADPSHVHTTLPLLATVLCSADSVDKLAAWLDAAMALVGRRRGAVEWTLIRAEQLLVMVHMGQIAKARTLSADAAHLSTVDSNALVAMALVAMETRDVDLAEQILSDDKQRGASACTDVVSHMLRSFAVAMRGNLTAGLELFLDGGRQLDRLGWCNASLFPWRLWAARLHRRLGDLAAARDLVQQELAVAREYGAPTAIGRALRILGGLTDGDQGLALLREAVDVLESSPNVLERAKASRLLGFRLGSADRAEAVEHLKQSRKLATEAGVDWPSGPAEQSGGAQASSPASTDLVRLTATEYRVADLAAHDHTNQQISRELEISCRAVEKHLTKAYRKLGIKGRGELLESLFR